MGLPAKSGIGGLAVEQNDGTEEGLALHAPLDVETALIDGSNVIYNSVASITNTGPVEFIVPRDNECSFILNQTRISGHFIVKEKDGSQCFLMIVIFIIALLVINFGAISFT